MPEHAADFTENSVLARASPQLLLVRARLQRVLEQARVAHRSAELRGVGEVAAQPNGGVPLGHVREVESLCTGCHELVIGIARVSLKPLAAPAQLSRPGR